MLPMAELPRVVLSKPLTHTVSMLRRPGTGLALSTQTIWLAVVVGSPAAPVQGRFSAVHPPALRAGRKRLAGGGGYF